MEIRKLKYSAFFVFAFVGCKVHRDKLIIKTDKFLNLSEIRHDLEIHSSAQQRNSSLISGIQFERDSLIIKANAPFSEQLFYTEKNKLNGNFTEILGSISDGYKKTIEKYNNPIVETLNFYPNGNLKSMGNIYSEDHLKKSRRITFPIGKWFFFNEKGILIKELNYSDVYKFSFEKLIKFLTGKANLDRITIEGYDYDDGKAFWEISYINNKDQLCRMKLNAKSGKVISDIQNIRMIE